MEVLNFMQPDNPIAKWLVFFLLALFGLWATGVIISCLLLYKQHQQLHRCKEIDILIAAPQVMGLTNAVVLNPNELAEMEFRRFCEDRSLKEDSIIGAHLKAIFDAGRQESRLEVGELIRHTINELFRINNLFRSLLATFIVIGLLGALFGLSDSLSHLAPDAANSTAPTNVQLSQNLTQLLGQLKSAFAPSIWGIFLTIIGVIFFALYIQFYCAPVRKTLEQLTLTVWVPKLYPTITQKMQEAVVRSEQQMVKSLSAAKKVAEFAESVQSEAGDLQGNLKRSNKAFKLLNEHATSINLFTSSFTNSIRGLTNFQSEIHGLYQALKDDSNVFHKQVQDSITDTQEFHSEIGALLIAHQQKLETALLGLSSYEKAYIESRSTIDANISSVLEHAQKAYSVLGERNQELVTLIGNPLRDDLAAKLKAIEDTLRIQLQGIQTQFGAFDVPIRLAAEKIEGSLESVVKRTETLTREMQREIIKIEEQHMGQLGHLSDLNEQIKSMLAELEQAKKQQREQSVNANHEVVSLTSNVATLNTSIVELTKGIGLSGKLFQSVEEIAVHQKYLADAMKEISLANQSHRESVESLFRQLVIDVQHRADGHQTVIEEEAPQQPRSRWSQGLAKMLGRD